MLLKTPICYFKGDNPLKIQYSFFSFEIIPVIFNTNFNAPGISFSSPVVEYAFIHHFFTELAASHGH